MTKIDSNSEGVISMILDKQKIYTNYLIQANKANK